MISFPSTSSSSPINNPKSDLRSPQNSKWRTGSQQRIYGRRLLEALRATRSGGPSPIAPRAIKDAADSALALTARGQTRWSRSLLFGRPRRRKVLLKAGGKIRRRRPLSAASMFASKPPPPQLLKGKKVRDRLCVLSRLVPGCRKLSPLSLLEEAADYVAALEMQVNTMRLLADALSAAAISSSGAGESAPPC